MKAKRTINYPDLDLPCPICSRRFKTRQGLAGHMQFKHASASEGALPVIDKASPGGSVELSVKDLKGQVERMELELKKRKLQAELPSTAARASDIMEQSGLGPFTEQSRTLAQKRALGIMDQEKAPGWLEKVLGNPEGLRIVIEGLKSVLGTNNNNGDNSLKILSDLGFNLKDLLQNSLAPKGSASFEVGGLNLSGASLTPQLLSSLLDYKAKTESAQIEAAGKKEMSDTLKGLLHTIGEGIASGSISLSKPGPGRAVSREMPGSDPGDEGIFNCPACGFENRLPADIGLGVEIHCQSPDCSQIWVTEASQARQPKPKREKRQVKVNPPVVEETPCPGCGQLLNLDGRSIGDVVRCSVCGDELTVNSETLAVPASEPLSEAEKQSKSFLRE